MGSKESSKEVIISQRFYLILRFVENKIVSSNKPSKNSLKEKRRAELRAEALKIKSFLISAVSIKKISEGIFDGLTETPLFADNSVVISEDSPLLKFIRKVEPGVIIISIKEPSLGGEGSEIITGKEITNKCIHHLSIALMEEIRNVKSILALGGFRILENILIQYNNSSDPDKHLIIRGEDSIWIN